MVVPASLVAVDLRFNRQILGHNICNYWWLWSIRRILLILIGWRLSGERTTSVTHRHQFSSFQVWPWRRCERLLRCVTLRTPWSTHVALIPLSKPILCKLRLILQGSFVLLCSWLSTHRRTPDLLTSSIGWWKCSLLCQGEWCPRG